MNGIYGKRSSVYVQSRSMRVLYLIHRDELDRSMFQFNTETNSTTQYRSVRSTSTYGAPNVRDMQCCMCAVYSAS